jgi:hypothetical protein
MNSALFYPWIEITDQAWLNTSFLYWQSIRTIVPESINEPLALHTTSTSKNRFVVAPIAICYRCHVSLGTSLARLHEGLQATGVRGCYGAAELADASDLLSAAKIAAHGETGGVELELWRDHGRGGLALLGFLRFDAPCDTF